MKELKNNLNSSDLYLKNFMDFRTFKEINFLLYFENTI